MKLQALYRSTLFALNICEVSAKYTFLTSAVCRSNLSPGLIFFGRSSKLRVEASSPTLHSCTPIISQRKKKKKETDKKSCSMREHWKLPTVSLCNHEKD